MEVPATGVGSWITGACVSMVPGTGACEGLGTAAGVGLQVRATVCLSASDWWDQNGWNQVPDTGVGQEVRSPFVNSASNYSKWVSISEEQAGLACM